MPAAVRPKAAGSPHGLRARARPRAKLARQTSGYGEQLGAVNLTSADLRKTYFRGVSAPGARLRKARLQWAYMRFGDFKRADFREADLAGAHLIRSRLHDADFRGANLEGTRLDRSELPGANLEDTENLTQAQLDAACGDAKTKLPPGLHITTCDQLEVNEWERRATVGVEAPSGVGELLVATPSRGCTTRRCPEPCCNTCRPIQWELAADPDVQLVPKGVALPDHPANECGVHYDLRAEGDRQGDRFLVRSLRPVPSRRARRPGAPGRLELRAKMDGCTTMGCGLGDPCCNTWGFEGWRPRPSLDVITWSGEALPDADRRDCDQGFDLAVTGTWQGPSEFEVKTVRKLRW